MEALIQFSDCSKEKRCPDCPLGGRDETSVRALNALVDYVDEISQDTAGAFGTSDVQRFIRQHNAPAGDQQAVAAAARMIVEGECTTSQRY